MPFEKIINRKIKAKPLSHRLSLIFIVLFANCLANSSKHLRDADQIDFVKAPGYLCGGYYKLTSLKHLADGKIIITANQTSLLPKGFSELKGGISIERDLQLITAEGARIENENLDKVKNINLYGNIQYTEPYRFIRGSNAHFDLEKNTGKIQNATYRLLLQEPTHQYRYQGIVGWGHAEEIEKLNNNRYQLKQATYTSCPPSSGGWHIKAKALSIDKDQGRGQSYHTKLYLGKTPIFYSPYLSFPIDKKRKTGFLNPYYGLSDRVGFDIALPFYWNIAPQFDATITPHYFTKRGLLLHNQLRYLSPKGRGELTIYYVPHDKNFAKQFTRTRMFKRQRGAIDFVHQTKLSKHWKLDLESHLVTDDDFPQDFRALTGRFLLYQLRNQAAASYEDRHITFLARVQAFQTIQPANRVRQGFAYHRLPHIQWRWFPYSNHAMNLEFFTDYNHFLWGGDKQAVPWTDIDRLVFSPKMHLSFVKNPSYIKPQIELNQRFYNLRGLSHSPILQQRYSHRSIPILNVEIGTKFFASYHGQTPFEHSIEPRMSYTYIPHIEQKFLPLIDSSYELFNYNNLFKPNRFYGHDRVGDSHHINMAIETQLQHQEGFEWLQAGVGQRIYLQRRHTLLGVSNLNAARTAFGNPTLTQAQLERFYLGYTSTTDTLSPLVGAIKLTPNPTWTLRADISYEANYKRVNNGHFDIIYTPQYYARFGLGYSFVRNGESLIPSVIPTFRTRHLHQINASAYFPFNERWSTYGGISYNIEAKYIRHYFLGVEYNGCCWATRILAGRAFIGIDERLRPNFNKFIYFQIVLKGLGSYQSDELVRLLKHQIPNFNDRFTSIGKVK